MDVTSKLLRVFLVEKQIRGLTSRLRQSEQFLNEQSRQLVDLEARRATLDAQIQKATVIASDSDGEMKRIDERVAVIREQMNSAQTQKEYKAFLTELNTFKTERDKLETSALESMTKVDELRTQRAEVETNRAEREKVREVASQERQKRADEIRERLEQLNAERIRLAGELPAPALTTLEGLLKTKGEEAMAPIEEQDRKRHEFNCGSCMMSLPVEAISGLLSSGKLTKCVSCGCLLYLEKELSEAMAAMTASKR